MNWIEQERSKAEVIKSMYPTGTRIELIGMNDPYAPIPPGTRGEVIHVDDMGTLHMKWDNGRTLGVVPDEDCFRKLAEEEIVSESNKINTIDKIEKVKLCIDESDGFFEGYISGQRWNGWECPMFSKNIAEQICKAFSDNETIDISYDEHSDCFIINYLSEEIIDKVEGKDYEINGKLTRLYPIGSGEWCWDKATEEQNLDNSPVQSM